MNTSLFKSLIAHFLDHADETELEDGTTTYEFEGMLERDEPLTFTYHGHPIRAWVYSRYNATEVLYIETEVGIFRENIATHHFIATNSGKLPFSTIRVDRQVAHEPRVHVVSSHSLIAREVTSASLGEVLDGLTYSAKRAQEKLSHIEAGQHRRTIARQEEEDAEAEAIKRLIDNINEDYVKGGTADDNPDVVLEEGDDADNSDESDDDSDDSDEFTVVDDGTSITDNSDKFDDVTVARVHQQHTPSPTADILKELDALVGLEPVKAMVRELAATHEIAKLRQQAGLVIAQPSPHLVFTGNPGTGKTTVARIVGRLYKSLGMLSKGHVVETDRSGLVAAYIGQTALKTRKICESALGGVLFIDEAYALAGDDRDYGIEAIEALLTFMEAHRGDIAVVVAGYPMQMNRFIASNPGLRSRFDITVGFPDYSNDELAQIFTKLASEFDYTLDAEAEHTLARVIASMPRHEGFGNGREMRKLFHATVRRQAQLLHANVGATMSTSTLRSLGAEAICNGPLVVQQSHQQQTLWGYL